MSLFSFPRIHFWGTHYTNPGTANNDSLGPGTEITYTSDTETVQPATGPITQGMTDDQYRDWLRQTGNVDGLGEVLNSQWNLYGDMSFEWLDVKVQSVRLGHDRLVTDSSEEPLIGAALYLARAIMCDNNPEGFNTTQWFAEALQMFSPEVIDSPGVWLSRKPTRAATIRGLNWDRNMSFHTAVPNTSGGAGGASGTFQHVIEMTPDDWKAPNHQTDAVSAVRNKLLVREGVSPVMDALRALFLSDTPPKGLVLRYNLYLTYPRLSDTELAADFAQGIPTENPAIGWLNGTIAPWYGEEPTSATMGRFLGKAGDFVNPYTTSRRYYLSGAVAKLDTQAKWVSVDCVDTFPEDGSSGDKYDLGQVILGVRRATPPGTDPRKNDATIYPIGELPNDQQTWKDNGGIYELNYAWLPEEVQQGLEDTEHHAWELVLQTSRYGVLLFEQEYMVSPGSKCNYIDALEPGTSWTRERVDQQLPAKPEALSGRTALYIMRRGVVYDQPLQATIEQWQFTPTGTQSDPDVYTWPMLLYRQTQTIQNGLPLYLIPKMGQYGSGVRMYRFIPPGHWPDELSPQNVAWGLTDEYFVSQRVLPYDDYSDISDDELTFEFIYQQIFRYYYLLLPAMNKRLDMRDESIWSSPTAARYLLRTLDPNLWEYYDYMPRTRDLSTYRRQLLRRWCEKVLATEAAENIADRAVHGRPQGRPAAPGGQPATRHKALQRAGLLKDTRSNGGK